MKKLFTCLIFITLNFFLVNSLIQAQDIHFSQFDIAGQTYNPATSGAIKDDFRFTSHYKDQWRSIGTPYKTGFASCDFKTRPKKSSKNSLGLGVSFYNDRAGTAKLGTSMASLSLSYHIHLNQENSLGAGIQNGFGQRSIHLEGLKWDNQFDGDTYDPSRNPNENMQANNIVFFDLSGGLFWNYIEDDYIKINAGISGSHLNAPRQSFYENADRTFPKILIHGGAEIPWENTNTTILPAFMIIKQGPFQEINAGGMIKYILGTDSKYTGLRTSSAFYIGSFFRYGDAIAMVTRFDFKNSLSIGFSYDINVSRLRLASSGRGGMEISLVYRGVFDRK